MHCIWAAYCSIKLSAVGLTGFFFTSFFMLDGEFSEASVWSSRDDQVQQRAML